MNNKEKLFKQIPKVDTLINEFTTEYNKNILKISINETLDEIRNKINKSQITNIDKKQIINTIKIKYNKILKGSIEPVINATGIVIHTNLGRSPIPKSSFENIIDIVCGYSNLEYDLNTSLRGERYHHIKKILQIITGCENALIVNNNAAAVFLILNTFSKNKETIVSRGELIEIGGSFRIPDVMSGSGTILKEVGTTNKTKKADYTNAINENTAMIMKVHTSNYKIIGFTEEVDVKSIPEIANKNGIISYYDAGSGSIRKTFNSCDDISLKMLNKFGFDLISASGDKMLGGPQAGIIIGKSKYISKLKTNPLLRMLRVDKITLALLQETLKNYMLSEYEQIPVLKMLNENIKSLKKKALKLKKLLDENNNLNITISVDKTFVGGGSCPMEEIETVVLEIQTPSISTEKIEAYLRNYKTPIICRIKDNKIIIDLRTIFDNQIKIIANAFKNIGNT